VLTHANPIVKAAAEETWRNAMADLARADGVGHTLNLPAPAMTAGPGYLWLSEPR
jgi:hypothetical protein